MEVSLPAGFVRRGVIGVIGAWAFGVVSCGKNAWKMRGEDTTYGRL
jgi:hypothetical protein